MNRLSSSIERIQDHYPVVVVGSGYGGAIAASRLARAGQRVCVLERGREFQPGEYPDTEAEALHEMQVSGPGIRKGSPTGLYDFRLNRDINVFVGCGLGGTSLVNANVSLRAEPRVFQDLKWPKAIREDAEGLLLEGYRRAEEMLKPKPYPKEGKPLPKLEALERSAEFLGERFYRPPINVTFENGVNHVGVEQHRCEGCGDCVSGCNYGAKNTVLMNYLPDAWNHGAEIFTEVAVERLERRKDRWLVHFRIPHSGREKFGASTMFVTANVAILAAGTLGSTEILLRSAQAGLPVSKALGHGFTGNGDVLAFGYNNDCVINGIGFGHRSPASMEPVGPCISGIIDAREKPELSDGMVIEEGSVPGALAALLPGPLAASGGVLGKDSDHGVADWMEERRRVLASMIGGPYRGAVHHTQVYLVMAHDDGAGSMDLDGDRLRVQWPGAGDQKVFRRANERLREATRPLGGTFVPNPAWTKLTHHNLITVHPLGGCIMAEEAGVGVVNERGQVFSGPSGTAVHEGLYVCDGSVVPRPLGVNPLLTISALAERCCTLLARDRGWKIDYRLPSAPSRRSEPKKLGIQFTETMRGFFSPDPNLDYEAAAAKGKESENELAFTLTIRSDDLERLLADPAHETEMIGTVDAHALSPEPLTATQGIFNLLPVDPEKVGARRMIYRMNLSTPQGDSFHFEGFKTIHDDPGFDLWSDATTLYVTVRRGRDASGPVLGRGILKIRPDDFMRQMQTLRVTHASTPVQRLKAIARFGRFFGGALFDTYGGIAARSKVFDPDAPERKKRPLRVCAPEVREVSTFDGVRLRLTRYRGGAKGPIILSHGLGVSSLIFSIDTIETNLLEYLFAHGFDVWLLDFRASIDLPAAATSFSGDDIASLDYPAAVEAVKQATGAASVQMVAHCFGSTTFVMAMLAGLQGVRSAVCSQIGPHIVPPKMTRLKTGLHMPSVLEALGVESLTAYADTHENWRERLLDQALKLVPIQAEERCQNPVCRRISFLYAPLYEHDQLNDATHSALHEMFGIANIRAFEHLAEMCRKRHVVAADGSEIYLPHLDRLAIPIAFIHGAENACFLPESTEITLETLREANGDLYCRHVIPGYGHIDCIFGKDAARDVYPFILEHLERT
ncbi:MAG TPA: alpha/beta fold hydrolase [Candidatus Polarisedimenticolia bacterium]|nr:alpha/beta fold hydrolase [Candidatus Polarisedimenticolia bacterium]